MLAFQHVASHIPGLDARLMSLLWAFADRWGRVTPAACSCRCRSRSNVGRAGGRFASAVSTALSQLGREGVLRRMPAGWLLDNAASAAA